MRFKSMGVPDKLRIIFSHVNDAKRDQECSFGLDLSAREYDGTYRGFGDWVRVCAD